MVNWNSYSEQEKLAVLSRIDQLTTQIMSAKFHIHSVPQLEKTMLDFRFSYDPVLSPYCWLHNVLQKHQHQINDLQELGAELLPEFASADISDMMRNINKELLILSEAHFERYFY